MCKEREEGEESTVVLTQVPRRSESSFFSDGEENGRRILENKSRNAVLDMFNF